MNYIVAYNQDDQRKELELKANNERAALQGFRHRIEQKFEGMSLEELEITKIRVFPMSDETKAVIAESLTKIVKTL